MTKNQYLVFDSRGKYRGFIPSKEILEIFLKQRKGMKYRIEKVNVKKLPPKVVEEAFSDYYDIAPLEGIWLFRDEEDYYIDGLNTYVQDFSRLLEEWKNKFIKYFNLSDNEEKLIKRMMKICTHNIECVDVRFYEDDVIEYCQYLKVEKMLEYIIRSLE